jgi:N-acetylglucosamine-6-sulfatase
LVVGGMLVLWASVGVHGSSRHPPRPARQAGPPVTRPNLLVITTDDQTQAQFSETTMPFTWHYFQRRGSVFENSLAVPPLCCPSRAGFLTGEYAQNHGVLTNEGGYSYLRGKDNTLPVWLHDAGYRTDLVGKYLNDFPALGSSTPPGWDRFFAAGGETIGYRNFDVGVDGKPRHYGADTYSTDLYTRVSERFMQDAKRRGRPFFLWLTYNAPHTVPDGKPPCPGTKAQPKSLADYRRFAHVDLPSTPALAERNLSDKDRWVDKKGPLSVSQKAAVTRRWRCALSTLPPIDRGFRSIVAHLRRMGQLKRTIIVLTSDNGYFYGEHGIRSDKKLPYEPALRVPLAISIPPRVATQASPPRISSLVSNVDLAPTLLAYAHARPCGQPGGVQLLEAPRQPRTIRCREIDGHSLRPLLSGRTPDWTQNRTIPIELDEDFTYKAFRTPREIFMKLIADRRGRLARPDLELYNLRRDPYELHNLLAKDSRQSEQRVQALEARLHSLTVCRGTRGTGACP